MYGDRISYLREKHGLTQEQLALKIGITRAALSHYEKNRREPDLKTLQKLADFFEVSLDYISGRSDDPTPVKEFINEIDDETFMRYMDQIPKLDGEYDRKYVREKIIELLKVWKPDIPEAQLLPFKAHLEAILKEEDKKSNKE